MINITTLLNEIKSKKPLIHHITNYVTVNDCANICLAIGASPVMADAKEEVEDMVSISSALVLNIGTLNKEKIASMVLAGKKANEKGVPVVLDPVGAGATPFRIEMTKLLLKEIRMAVIRGNLSEIMSVAGENAVTKGVDNGGNLSLEGQIDVAKALAKEQKTVVVISGGTDVVTDGEKVTLVKNGDPFMPFITGSGCMSTTLIGAFCGANPEKIYESAAAAMISMGLAGEIAKQKEGKKGLGHLRAGIIDAIGNMNETILQKGAKYEEI